MYILKRACQPNAIWANSLLFGVQSASIKKHTRFPIKYIYVASHSSPHNFTTDCNYHQKNLILLAVLLYNSAERQISTQSYERKSCGDQ